MDYDDGSAPGFLFASSYTGRFLGPPRTKGLYKNLTGSFFILRAFMKMYRCKPPQRQSWTRSQGDMSPRHMVIRDMPIRKTKAPLLIETMHVFLSKMSLAMSMP